MKPKNPSKIPSRKKLIITGAIILVMIMILGWLGYAYANDQTANYAQLATRPIETAFIKAGAVKKCDRGDSGKGPDNRQPWYGAVFEIKDDVDLTKTLIKTSLIGDGFSESSFSFDQQYKEWTIANASKQSSYSLLSEGQVKFSATVYEQKHYDSANDKNFCTLSGQGKTQGITTFAIGVKLPEYK